MKYLLIAVLGLACLVGSASAAPKARVSDSIAKAPYLAALSLEAESGVELFADNAESRVYPASLTKLMTLYVVLRQIEQGKLALSDTVTVTKEAARMGGNQVYLRQKEQFPVEELLYALMVQSANDAATALAIHVAGSRETFVALMNQSAQELGMKQTVFYSEHGLPPGKGQKPDVSTARDLALLCRELVRRPEVLKYSSLATRGFRNNTFSMRNPNRLLGREGIDGLKTGAFRQAGASIALTAPQQGCRVIVLVLGSRSQKERDAKALDLLRTGLEKAPALAAAAHRAQQAAIEKQATPPSPPAEERRTPVKTKGSKWGKIFLGLGLGMFTLLTSILWMGRTLRKRQRKVRFRRR